MVQIMINDYPTLSHGILNQKSYRMRNLREDFVLDFSSHTFCNHGSYGSPPKQVLTKREHLLRQTEY